MSEPGGPGPIRIEIEFNPEDALEEFLRSIEIPEIGSGREQVIATLLAMDETAREQHVGTIFADYDENMKALIVEKSNAQFSTSSERQVYELTQNIALEISKAIILREIGLAEDYYDSLWYTRQNLLQLSLNLPGGQQILLAVSAALDSENT